MQRLALFLVLYCATATPYAQVTSVPHPATQIPPAQPPYVRNPAPPPQEKIDPKTGKADAAKLCTRQVFYPCPDERDKSCTRKETYPCD